jgi:hypothetical protein
VVELNTTMTHYCVAASAELLTDLESASVPALFPTFTLGSYRSLRRHGKPEATVEPLVFPEAPHFALGQVVARRNRTTHDTASAVARKLVTALNRWVDEGATHAPDVAAYLASCQRHLQRSWRLWQRRGQIKLVVNIT